MTRAAWSRIVPFALFMGFIGVEELGRTATRLGVVHLEPSDFLLAYPLRVAAVALILFFYRRQYRDIRWRDLAEWRNTLICVAAGALIFFLWINMDWTTASLSPPGFDPTLLPGILGPGVLLTARLTGAVLIVPVMEELFWRSFLLRYLVDTDFTKVAPGTFSWFSFSATSVLFALEHHYLVAGLMAGIALNLLMYFTRSLSQCILAHATANLALGLYVMQTGQWRFW